MNDQELHNWPVNDAKSSFIEAYFADLEEKSRFTLELSENGHRDEALLLCCTYIETLGDFLYWPHQHSRLNFARLLVEHGDVEALALAHPKPGPPEIRFNLLQLGLKNAIRAVRELSLESNRWFGHDFSSDG